MITGIDESIPILIDFLNSPSGNLETALKYLNSGNPELMEAGKEWTDRRGIELEERRTNNAPIKWNKRNQ